LQGLASAASLSEARANQTGNDIKNHNDTTKRSHFLFCRLGQSTAKSERNGSRDAWKIG
jgi:hypothetical protein